MGDEGWSLGPAICGMEWDGMRLYCRAEVSYVYLHVVCFSRQVRVSPDSRTRARVTWLVEAGTRLRDWGPCTLLINACLSPELAWW